MKAAGEGVLTEEQAKEVVDELDAYLKMKKQTMGTQDIDMEIVKHIKTLGNNALLQAAIEKRSEVLNLAARSKAMRYISRFENDPALGIKAYLGGTVKVYEGGRLSIDSLGRSLAMKYIGRFVDDLEKAGVFEIFTRGLLDREVAQEMWEIRPGGKQGISGSKEARTIAEIVHKWQSIAVDRQNRAGAFILKLPGYIVRQSHDQARVRRAGYETWRDIILPKLDPEKTFGTADPEEFLKSAYDAIKTGMHMRVQGAAESTHLTGFRGPSNVAKKASAERMLHFKSADDWTEYNTAFGTSNLREAVIYGLEHAARNTALMEGLGTNPHATLDSIIKSQKRKFREKEEIYDTLNSNGIMNLFKEIEGTSRIPVNINASRISSGIRIIQNMAKLGGAVLTSVADIPFQVSEMRYQGVSVFSAYANALQNVFRGRSKGDKDAIARMLGVGFDGIVGDIMSRFGPQDHVPGILSKMQQRFFKLNMLTWWNDSHRTGVALMMSNHLADQANKGFDQLDPELRRLFSMYEISPEEWSLIRTKGLTELNGNKYITPEGLRDIDDKTIAAVYGVSENSKRIEGLRDALENKLQAYFVDRTDFAVPIPNASERAIMNQGTQPGTPLGEALRFIMQFKSFPITAIHKQIGREIYGYGAMSMKESFLQGKGSAIGLAHLIGSTTLFGYLGLVLKDLAKGKEPRRMNNEKVVLAAMAQGGGLGIYGDFLFGEYQKYGRSALGTVAGPTLGQFDSVMAMWSSAVRGEDFGAEAIRFGVSNTPFMNLFYTKAAMDYMILYQLQEMANPGYLRRMETRMKNENEQQFFIPPSTTIPYGGGDEILEGVR